MKMLVIKVGLRVVHSEVFFRMKKDQPPLGKFSAEIEQNCGEKFRRAYRTLETER